MLVDRYILPKDKTVRVESIARLIGFRFAVEVIVKYPPPTLRMHEMTAKIVFASPKPPYLAISPVLSPHLDIDVTLIIERCEKFVPVLAASGRKIMIACKLKAYF
jgi:hypothetical protein